MRVARAKAEERAALARAAEQEMVALTKIDPDTIEDTLDNVNFALDEQADVDKVLAEFPVTEWGKYKNRFKAGGVKITLDGSPQGRTAFFTTPYLTGGPDGHQGHQGG